MFFDVYNPIEIVDVQVYTNTPGLRIIQLRDKFGATLASKVVNLTGSGQQTVLLNFRIEPGVDYELGLASNSPVINMYRSNGDINFPYTLDGLATITHSSSDQNNGLNHYYFFYNWNVKEGDCVSLRTPVIATVGNCFVGIDEINESSSVNSFINTSGNLSIEMFNLKGTYAVSIFNTLGQIVFTETIHVNSSEQNETLPVDKLSKGLYYVKVYNTSSNYTTKIVK